MKSRFDPADYRSPFTPQALAPHPDDPLQTPIILRERLNIFSFQIDEQYRLLRHGPLLTPPDVPFDMGQVIEANLYLYGLLRAPEGVGCCLDHYRAHRLERSAANAFLIHYGESAKHGTSTPTVPLSAAEEQAIMEVWAAIPRAERPRCWSYQREVRERLTPFGQFRFAYANDCEGFVSRHLYQLTGKRAIEIEEPDPELLGWFGVAAPAIETEPPA